MRVKLNAMARQVDSSVEEAQSSAKVQPRGVYQVFLAQIVTIDNANQYLECRDFDTTAATFVVLLPPIFTETSRGSVTYSYSGLNTRQATEATVVETQEITPSFVVGETIQVAYMRSVDTRMFVGDGRMWAKTG